MSENDHNSRKSGGTVEIRALLRESDKEVAKLMYATCFVEIRGEKPNDKMSLLKG